MRNLKRIYVFIIGAVLMAGIAAGSVFLLFKPKAEEIAKKRKEFEEKKSVADQLNQRKQAFEQAKRDVLKAKVDLVNYSRRFRKIHFEKATGDWDALFDLWHEYRDQMGPAIIRFMESTGCKLKSGISMPTPPLAPIPCPTSGFLAVPETGTMDITVEGSLQQIFALLRKLPKFEYLNEIGPVSISGTSPVLTATFPIKFYLVVEAPESIQLGAAGAGGEAAPGGGAPGPGGAGPPGAAPAGPGPAGGAPAPGSPPAAP